LTLSSFFRAEKRSVRYALVYGYVHYCCAAPYLRAMLASQWPHEARDPPIPVPKHAPSDIALVDSQADGVIPCTLLCMAKSHCSNLHICPPSAAGALQSRRKANLSPSGASISHRRPSFRLRDTASPPHPKPRSRHHPTTPSTHLQRMRTAPLKHTPPPTPPENSPSPRPPPNKHPTPHPPQ